MNYQTIHDWAFNNYKGNKSIITEVLADAIMKLYIIFDDQSSCSQHYSITGICVHYLDKEDMIHNFLLALLEQLGRHLGINYAKVIANILTKYNIVERIGFFVTDNAGNNDTCLEQLAIKFGFDKKEQRLHYAPYILN